MEQWLQQWLAQPRVQALIARGKNTGAITYEELNALLPPHLERDPDRLAEWVDRVLDYLDAAGIALIDGDEPEEPPATA